MSDITLAGGDLLEGTAPELLRVWRDATAAAQAGGGRRGLEITWRLVYPRGHAHAAGGGKEDAVGAAVLDAISSFMDRQRAAQANKSAGAHRLASRVAQYILPCMRKHSEG